jgi:cell division initiation protein
MPLQAKDVDNMTFPTAIRGYSEHAVDEFIDQVKTSLEAAEAALAEARAKATAGAGADSDPQQPVPAAARLLQIAQTPADEQLADAHAQAEQLASDARAQAEQLVSDAWAEAAATKAAAEQEAVRIVQTARATESAVQEHVNELRQTQASSRIDLRQLAQHLIEITDTTEHDTPPIAGQDHPR